MSLALTLTALYLVIGLLLAYLVIFAIANDIDTRNKIKQHAFFIRMSELKFTLILIFGLVFAWPIMLSGVLEKK